MVDDSRTTVRRRAVLKGAAGATVSGLATLAASSVADAADGAVDATAKKLEAYADLTSVAPGSPIRFFVNNGLSAGTSSTATMTIRRIAYPSDVDVATARVTVRGQTIPANVWATGCNWTATTTYTVPSTWPSGLYLALFTAGTLRGAVSFVVRATTPAALSRIVCQIPFTTAQAYNDWGGKSLYDVRSTNNVRSPRVSFDRPLSNPEYGDHFQWAYPFIRYAQRTGLAVDYVSSVDLHADPTLLDPYQLFVTVGHDEYWSRPMRQHLDHFVTGGGNAAILSGNTSYFQIRLDPNAAGTPNRIITCYKDWAADPIADINLKTVEWDEFGPSYKHAVGTYSQNASFGVGFVDGSVWSGTAARPASPFVAYRPGHWALAAAGLAAGSNFCGELVGYETDSLAWSTVNGLPVPTGTDGSPSNLNILAIADTRAWSKVAGQRGGHAVMGMFRNNGTVFNVGTVDWVKGLTSASATAERITTKVISRLATAKSARDRTVREMFQYHAKNADGSWRFLFSPSPFFTQKNTGWTYDGPAFWILGTPTAGAVGVKQYHYVAAGGGWSFRYQLATATPPAGWVDDGVSFYAYAAAGADTQPVYQYHAASAGTVDRVLYSTNPNMGLGWTLDGLAFHAPVKPALLSD